MNLGQDNIIKVYAGTSEVSKIYLGTDLVFSMDSKYVPPEWDDWEYRMNRTWDTSKYNTISCDGAYTGNGQYPNMIWEGSNSGYHTNTASHPHWIGFFTVPIKVNSFSFWTGASTYIPRYFEWQASNNGQDWITLGSYERENGDSDFTTYYIPEANKDYYKYHRLYITQGWGYYEFIGGFKLDADVSQSPVEWLQPALTSDTSYGTISSSVTTWGDSPVYQISDGVIGRDKWGANASNGASVTWVLPDSIRMQSCKVYQTNETPVLDRFPTSINIYGSNDGSSWDNIGSLTVNSIPAYEDYVTVNCSTNNYYSYYRWDFGASTNANGELAVSEIVIDAVQQP